jgi:uncharacterized membrane protein
MRWPGDWNLKNCLLLCGSLTAAEMLLTLMAAAGLDIPGLHQAVGFIFLTFVPGILLLRIFRIHDINTIESMTYSSGLSVALAMFSGTAVNFLLPLMGIAHPLETLPLLTTSVVEIIALMAIAWLRDRSYTASNHGPPSEWRKNVNTVLFLLATILLVIAGVKISDFTGSNWGLIAALAMIALIIGLGASGKFVMPALFPAALFVVALGLLYQTTLMSPGLVGTDIYTEYHYYQETALNGRWDWTLPNPVNSCTSIVILAPIYALMMGVNGMWVFKFAYPLLFSLVPLILFRIFQLQIGTRASFLAVAFFMIVPTFSLEMISLCRQQVAEIFLALTILLLIEKKLSSANKLIMLTVFSMAIAVSHYSIGFITLAYLVLVIPLLAIIRTGAFIRIWNKMTSWSGGIPDNMANNLENSIPLRLLLIPVVLYMISLLLWYSQVASGIDMTFIASVLNFQVNAVGTEIGNQINHAAGPIMQIGNRPDLIRTALGLDFIEASIPGKLFRLLQYITQALLILGCLRLLFSPRGLKLNGTYIALSVISVGMLLACILFPGFAGILNATRWYHIGLLTLAPFCLIGAETIWELLALAIREVGRRKPAGGNSNSNEGYLKYFTLFILIPYFIFTSGIFFELSRYQDISRVDIPYSIALSSQRLDIIGIFNSQDLAGASWLKDEGDHRSTVYADDHALKVFSLFGYPNPIVHFTRDTPAARSTYMYFTSWNNTKGELTFASTGKPGLRDHVQINDLPGLEAIIGNSDRVYCNGGSVLLRTP